MNNILFNVIKRVTKKDSFKLFLELNIKGDDLND
jgi:hypothetical protein